MLPSDYTTALGVRRQCILSTWTSCPADWNVSWMFINVQCLSIDVWNFSQKEVWIQFTETNSRSHVYALPRATIEKSFTQNIKYSPVTYMYISIILNVDICAHMFIKISRKNQMNRSLSFSKLMFSAEIMPVSHAISINSSTLQIYLRSLKFVNYLRQLDYANNRNYLY